jgi:PAS domain S-box-containing protein
MTTVRKNITVLSILYVEDEPEAREMVSRVLAKKIKSLQLYTAENGEEGLALYREHRPDIVITDINMPVMNGIRMGSEIKALNPEALIIAVTAYSDTSYLLKAIEIGISNYVLKPIDYDKLFAVIDKCIETVTLKIRIREQNDYIRQLSRAVEENPCSIVITNNKGLIEYVNPKFISMTGYSFEEAIGQNPRVLKSSKMPPYLYEKLWKTITAGKEWRGQFLNRKKNGELYWESASISPIFNEQGAITHFVAVKEDITERKLAEESIEELNTALAARAAELEAANQELDAFNYSVSHDLRKPLTVINSYCQVVQELYGNSLDKDCLGYISEMYEGTLRMSLLIDTLLDFSQITRVEVHNEKVDLHDIASNVASTLRITEPERKAVFHIRNGIQTQGDPKLLTIVLENLLGNAWKYTGTRDEAVIEFGVTEREGKPACFVRDNGIGFDMAYVEKLFLPFERSPDAMVFAGHGIGLTTVQRIIKRHGGKVWAEGELGHGATFYFTLPVVDIVES